LVGGDETDGRKATASYRYNARRRKATMTQPANKQERPAEEAQQLATQQRYECISLTRTPERTTRLLA